MTLKYQIGDRFLIKTYIKIIGSDLNGKNCYLTDKGHWYTETELDDLNPRNTDTKSILSEEITNKNNVVMPDFDMWAYNLIYNQLISINGREILSNDLKQAFEQGYNLKKSELSGNIEFDSWKVL